MSALPVRSVERKWLQECIRVGCVPPAAVAVCWGGVSASVHAGIHPQVWAGDPPGCGPGTTPLVQAWRPPSPSHTPQLPPPDVGLDTPPGQTPQLPSMGGPGDPHPLWTEFSTYASEDITLPQRRRNQYALFTLHSRFPVLELMN